ncbi:hypothetical protein F511_19024 [Dorcoceras hygrometricum]|uniref:Uncharacterized protein n=1 Tax=Dorcoceras hygrometricum TaxID=472368 RepID=A0A2Z7BTM6_9LAMI|nr:hypothetical protein F511_19024 [Dorcoceras hygrometricum]
MSAVSMEEERVIPFPAESAEENNHGWQKVTYAKKQRKNQPKTVSDHATTALPNGSAEKNGVFSSLEKHAAERRRKLEAQRASQAVYDDDDIPLRSRKKWGDEDDEDVSSDADIDSKENNAAESNMKEKPKKFKKPKVTVAEAAGKIDDSDLASFLSGISESYEGNQDIQLMRFADYFGRAFSAVSASQFPWLKLLRESPVAKYTDIPVSCIPEAVYKTSIDWINHHSYEALENFLLWSVDGILQDLAVQQSTSKGSKKGGSLPPSKSQVAIFVVLAMVLRRKPDALINVLPKLSENPKYQGQDKLLVIIWMAVQACQGDLGVGLLLWAHHILPILGGKSGSNPQSRDLVLQTVERILSAPKARSILVNSAVRKGERLVPPAALDLLLHLTFPASSARVKATERFHVVYPILKEVALAGSPGSKAMKQVPYKLQALAVKAAGEGIPELSREATSIFIWCLSQSPDCYQQWDKIYLDNVEASVAILRKLAEGWKEFSSKQSSLQALGETLKSFRQKNKEASSGGVDDVRQPFFKDADKYCKSISGKLSSGGGCVKTVVFTIIVFAVGAAVMSPNIDSWDFNKLSVLFNTIQ